MRLRVSHRRFLSVAIFASAIALAGADVNASKKQSAHDKFYEHAIELLSEGDHKGAIIELKNALQADPKDLTARVLLGNTYLEIKDGTSAAKELLRARKDGAGDSFVLAPLGRAYLMQGQFRKALEVLSAAGQAPATAVEIAIIRGEAHLALREFAKAEQFYLEASKRRAKNAVALAGLARVKIGVGDFAGAKQYAKWAVEADPKFADAWFMQGEVARLDRDFDLAIERYNRAVALSPRFWRALIARASIAIDRGRHLDAEQDIALVREIDPRNPRAAYLQALILARSGKVREAQQSLIEAETILKGYPSDFIENDPPSILLLGVVSYFRGDHPTAYTFLRTYLKRVPQHLGARKLLAAIALSNGEAEQAIFLLEALYKRVPKDVEVLTMYGDALMRAKRHRDAAKILEKAAALAKPGSSALARLVVLRLGAGQDVAAANLLKKEMARDPDAVQAALLLTTSLMRRGEFEAALRTARAVLERDPKNPVAHNLVAGSKLGLKDVEGARRSFKAAFEAAPNYLPAIENLAKLEYRLGNRDTAIDLYETVLDKSPGNGPAMLALAEIERQRNELGSAIRWLEKARTDSTTPQVAALRLVDIYIAANRLDKALSVARKLNGEDPANLVYLTALGRARLAAKRHELAAQTFKEVAARAGDKEMVSWLQRTAVWQARALDRQGARESLQKALAIDARHLPSHIELFKMEMSAGDLEGAMARARTVAKLDRRSQIGVMLQGDVNMRRRNYDAALRAFSAALKKAPSPTLAVRVYRARVATGRSPLEFAQRWAAQYPDDVVSQRLLATAFADAGRDDDAIAIYEGLLRKTPKDTVLLNNMALLYQKKDESRALEYAERAYEAAPAQPAVMDTYGWILVQQGQMDEGTALLRNALLRAPGVPEIHYHLAVALNKSGKKEEARRELRAALQFGHQFEGIAEARRLLKQLTSTRP